VFISWNGPNGGDPWMSVSHDFGVTWTQTQLDNSTRYYFAYDATVLPNGTIVFSEGSIDYSGPGGSAVGNVEHRAFVSTNNGASWTNVLVDSVSDRRAVHGGRLRLGLLPRPQRRQRRCERRPRVRVRRRHRRPGAAADLGAALDERRAHLERAHVAVGRGEEATSPTVESTGAGDVRSWYFQTTGNNTDVWNIYYRSSADGGVTWTAPVRISDATGGAAYKTAAGFAEVYGDYGEIAITNTGRRSGSGRGHELRPGPAECGGTGRRRRERDRLTGYLSTSPTTKKIEPRIEMRSGTSVPGSIAGITLTFEKDAVRIFSRYGCSLPSPTT
jgi:hypothetical protein